MESKNQLCVVARAFANALRAFYAQTGPKTCASDMSAACDECHLVDVCMAFKELNNALAMLKEMEKKEARKSFFWQARCPYCGTEVRYRVAKVMEDEVGECPVG